MTNENDLGRTGAQGAQAGEQLPASVDVLVVGYGPVGATIACLLGRLGVHALVVDKATEILMLPRAIGLDNEAQRILQLAGLQEGAFETMAITECRLLSPWFGEFLRIPTSGVIDGYARLITFYQPDLERALRRQAATQQSVDFVGGLELIDFQESGDGVSVTLARADGSRAEVHARYLIGADGASSIVRRKIGQDFVGQSYVEEWLIVDSLQSKQKLPHIEFHCRPDGARPHVPAPGKRERWEFMLGPGQTAEQMETDAEIQKLLAPWGDSSTMRIERKAIYRFHARCCQSFRKGRVFLAGDSAHITPPFAGQGLVSGLRDAANLCWKLAWVLQGRADARILDSYDTERRPHAEAMITLARRLGKLIMPINPAKAFAVHGLIRALRLIPPVRRYLDGAKLKPTLTYPEGLFVAGRDRLLRGAWMRQALVRDANGHHVLSDEILGDHLTLMGFGVDPREHLDATTLAHWQRTGGNVVQIAARGQSTGLGAQSFEDLTGEFIPASAPFGWAAVVRPDRTILHDGPIAEAARLIAESQALLGTLHAKLDPHSVLGAIAADIAQAAVESIETDSATTETISGMTEAIAASAVPDTTRRASDG